ncbi:MAG TPA: lysophospholipid acyltransferase family protein, partial [Thermoanaerobaculia bacterium]|nr:lysophospholipid acyltransferase family protein [Thermoanaerobaculia bacterium]
PRRPSEHLTARPRTPAGGPPRELPFAPSLVPKLPEGLFAALLGESARLTEENPRITSPRGLVDFWNLLQHRSRTLDLDDFGFDEPAAETWRPFFEFLYRVWWRVTATGLENVPGTGRALLVANHSGVLPWDGAMVTTGLRLEHPSRREARMLILDMFTTLPFLQPWLREMGHVRACPENGERLLARDELVCVFPEGIKGVGKLFRDRYRLARFGRGGFVRLALRTGAPIIPVSVVGAEEIYPNLARLDFVGRPLGLPYFPVTPFFPALGLLGTVPLPTKWWIDFGRPIVFDRRPDIAERPMIVNELADKVRSTLQTMIDSRLTRRGDLFTGE